MKVKSAPYTLKPFKFPDGFVLCVDTREQAHLLDRFPPGLTVQSKVLTDGDYSILGYEHQFAIERKGISDLISYCTSERVAKTMPKMMRFLTMDWIGLVIEVDEPDLLKPQVFSKVSPETIRQSLASFEIRYGIHVYMNSDRKAVLRWVLDRAIKFYNIQHEGVNICGQV